MYPFITVFGFDIRVYDLLGIVGYFLAACYPIIYHERLGIKRWHLVVFIFVGFLVQLYGGMIIPMLHRKFILHQANWAACVGRYFHSVFLSFLAYLILVSLAMKWPLKKTADFFIIPAMLLTTIGRIGCFYQGCCYGKPSTLPWAMRCPGYLNETAHPAQLYMFFSELIITLGLYAYHRHTARDGETFWLGITIYSAYRFGIEFFRTNPEFILGLSHAQVFSAVTFFVGIVPLVLRPRKKAPAH